MGLRVNVSLDVPLHPFLFHHLPAVPTSSPGSLIFPPPWWGAGHSHRAPQAAGYRRRSFSRALAICLLSGSQSPSWFSLGVESEDWDAGNGLPSAPAPGLWSWRMSTSATRLLCPQTHTTGLWVEPVYQHGDTQASPPLSWFLRGEEGGVFTRQEILPLVCSSYPALWLCS